MLFDISKQEYSEDSFIYYYIYYIPFPWYSGRIKEKEYKEIHF